MSKLSNENLFLLEFLVEDLQMDKKCDCTQPPGELCVSFQFLDNMDLDICEKDFSPEKKFSPTNDNNRTGKSCLFSLTPAQAQGALQNFDIQVNVCRKMQPGWDPEKIIVGGVSISVLPLLEGLLQSRDLTPAAKVLQESFQLKDANGRNVGTISVYIRMSCYGKMIITQFQMNLDDKSVLFKDKEGRSLYRYKKSKKKGKEQKIEDLSPNEQDCDPKCKAFKIVDQPPEQMFNQNQFATNPNCPTQPCYPNEQPGFGYGSPFSPPGAPSFPPQNLNCPMTPCYPNGPSGFDGGFQGFGGAMNFASPPGYNNFGGFGAPSQNFGAMPPCFPDFTGGAGNVAPDWDRGPAAMGNGGMGVQRGRGDGKTRPQSAPAPEVSMFFPPCLPPQTTAMPLANYPGPQSQRNNQTTRLSIGVGGGYGNVPPKTGGCGGGCGK